MALSLKPWNMSEDKFGWAAKALAVVRTSLAQQVLDLVRNTLADTGPPRPHPVQLISLRRRDTLREGRRLAHSSTFDPRLVCKFIKFVPAATV